MEERIYNASEATTFSAVSLNAVKIKLALKLISNPRRVRSHRPIHGQNIQLSRCSNQTKCHLSYSNTNEFFLAITIVYIKSITCSIIRDIFAGA